MKRLSDFQLLVFGEIAETATGERPWFGQGRMTHAYELARALDRAGTLQEVQYLPEHERERQRIEIVNALQCLLQPFRWQDIIRHDPPPSRELTDAREQIAALEDELSMLKGGASPAKGERLFTKAEVSALLAEACAPIMHQGSGIARLTDTVGITPRHLGDHPGW